MLENPSEAKRINDYYKEAFINEMSTNKRDRAFIFKITNVRSSYNSSQNIYSQLLV